MFSVYWNDDAKKLISKKKWGVHDESLLKEYIDLDGFGVPIINKKEIIQNTFVDDRPKHFHLFLFFQKDITN